MADAVVIGSGPNGLVAANLLADAGLETLVLEAQPEPGGAVKSGEVTLPGYRHDLFSAFYPLTAASDVMRGLELERHGLEWVRSEVVVAHPGAGGRCAALHLDLDATAASLERFGEGDGDAWRELYGLWERCGPAFVKALLSLFPPVRGGLGLARAVGPRNLPEFLRFGLLPVRRLAEERFSGEGAGWLLAGNALHADLTPDSAGGGLFGWLLCGIGQQLGWPTPRGGAGELTRALVSRLRSKGGEVRTGAEVVSIEVDGGRATGVVTGGGERVKARHAVLADVGAQALYERLLPADAVSERRRRGVRERFQLDSSTIKVNWALSAPIPWAAEEARRAGTVHVARGMDGLTAASSELVRNLVPERPFCVLGQYASFDSSRAPDGGEAAWAYTHVPQTVDRDVGGEEITGEWDAREVGLVADRMEAEIELLAPGFRELIQSRRLQGPRELEASNANLVGGAINGGTAQVHQQLAFRPFPGTGRPDTGVRGLYLASSAAHPGGGVHGGPGSNAAVLAIRHARARRAASRLRIGESGYETAR